MRESWKVSACLVGSCAALCTAQLQLRPRSYVFLLQDTRDADWYIRAFDEQGALYSELLLNVDRMPTYTGFAVVAGRLFATTYDIRTLVEFDPMTGDQIASYEADPGEIVIGLDSDQRELFLNGFYDWTAAYSLDGQALGMLPKPDGFTGGGLISTHGGSIPYYDEQVDTVFECDRAGTVLDTVECDNLIAFPDGLEYDASSDEFLFTTPGLLRRFDRQGALLDTVVLNGFGASFHSGSDYYAIPAPPALATGAAVLLLGVRPKRNPRPG